MPIVIGPLIYEESAISLVCFLSNPLALEGNKRNGNLQGPGEEETWKSKSKSLVYLSEQEVLR